MAPLRGWSPCGERLKAHAPFGHWNTTTFLAALRSDRIDAPWMIDGPINGERFRVYVEQVLAPALAPGDIVIMDNLGSHKGKAVRRAIRQAGAKLIFLPKYSPDLNPIEQLFAKLKHRLRTAQQRTREALSDAVAEILAAISPQECSNYLKHDGYGVNLNQSCLDRRHPLPVEAWSPSASGAGSHRPAGAAWPRR